MSKHLVARREFLSFGVLSALVALGCRKKAELPFSEYGETIDRLPVIEDLPASFEISDKLDCGKDCQVRQLAEESNLRQLYKSQGRTEELGALELNK